mgnify:CR=1 FL=1
MRSDSFDRGRFPPSASPPAIRLPRATRPRGTSHCLPAAHQPGVAEFRRRAARALRFVVQAVFLAVAFALSCSAPAAAQVGNRGAPSPEYFGIFPTFFDGEYRDALKLFEDQVRGAIKTSQARWIDSICYETMVGECYHEMGRLDEALSHYTAALRLYVAYYDWMIRVQFAPTIRPMTTVRPVPWGASSRTARLGFYPTTTLIAQGQVDINAQIKRGGPVQPATLYPVNVQEIVRCTALAMRRRAKILGPTCSYDPLTQEVANALLRRPGPPNHWSEAWINLQLGLALVAAGKEAQGINALKQSLVAGGEYDHPLTCVALLELGRLALANGDYPTAAKYFEESTYSAFHYDDLGTLEEAFHYAALVHQLANRPGVMVPLAAAAQWAKVKNLRRLRASLLLSACEIAAFQGQPAQARELLAEAQQVVGRRLMGQGRIGARAGYLGALISYQQGRTAEGDAALRTVLVFMQQGGYWLYHIKLADVLCSSRNVTPRVAMEMYDEVLRDPQPSDWQSDPLEALAVLTTPHPGPYERWFEIALDRKEFETALQIADRARRHRFFSTLPMGGRLLSLRWVLEAPIEQLDVASRLHRQDLLARYPAYAQLSKTAVELRRALAQQPLAPADAEAAREQSAAWQRLAAISVQQEAALREMAVRREPAGLVFPPLMETQAIQKALPPGHALLVFFATSRQTYGFLLNNEKYSYWSVVSPPTVARQTQALLRQWGLFAANNEVPVKDLADPAWQTSAHQLLEGLMKGSKADFTQPFEELIIVPDGLLWYLPFEALTVKIDDRFVPLIERVRIRYAPTAALAVASLPGPPTPSNSVVVPGKLFPRDDAETAVRAAERLAAGLPGTVVLRGPLPAPSAIFGSILHRLVVLDDLPATSVNPLEWGPLSLDRGKPGSALIDWLAFPWGGPAEVVLPGFHTATEDAMKSLPKPWPGNDLFLTSCALMASGARTVLISRWRTGGRTGEMLMAEFAQELPHTSAAEAWQRAALLARQTEVDPAGEPRAKAAANDPPIKGDHPFFWAAYLLIDAGPKPAPTDKPAENQFRIKQPEPAPPAAPGNPAPVKPAPGNVAPGGPPPAAQN